MNWKSFRKATLTACAGAAILYGASLYGASKEYQRSALIKEIEQNGYSVDDCIRVIRDNKGNREEKYTCVFKIHGPGSWIILGELQRNYMNPTTPAIFYDFGEPRTAVNDSLYQTFRADHENLMKLLHDTNTPVHPNN